MPIQGTEIGGKTPRVGSMRAFVWSLETKHLWAVHRGGPPENKYAPDCPIMTNGFYSYPNPIF